MKQAAKKDARVLQRAQVVRLSRKDILEQTDLRLRGECFGLAVGAITSVVDPTKRPTIDDMIRGADKVYAWMKERKLPVAANVEALSGRD